MSKGRYSLCVCASGCRSPVSPSFGIFLDFDNNNNNIPRRSDTISKLGSSPGQTDSHNINTTLKLFDVQCGIYDVCHANSYLPKVGLSHQLYDAAKSQEISVWGLGVAVVYFAYKDLKTTKMYQTKLIFRQSFLASSQLSANLIGRQSQFVLGHLSWEDGNSDWRTPKKTSEDFSLIIRFKTNISTAGWGDLWEKLTQLTGGVLKLTRGNQSEAKQLQSEVRPNVSELFMLSGFKLILPWWKNLTFTMTCSLKTAMGKILWALKETSTGQTSVNGASYCTKGCNNDLN